MAVPTTYVFKNGDNTQSTYHSYSTIDNAINLVASDLLVKVQESGVWVTKTGESHYTVDKPNTRIQFTADNVPATGTKNVRIERYTDVSAAEAVFASGTAIKAVDLNKNQDQFRHSAAELTNTKVDALNPSVQGELKFEDGNGKSLTITSNDSGDLAADRTIHFPDADGTVVLNTMAHNKLLVGTTQTENGNEIMRKATVVGDVTLSHDNSSNEATLSIGANKVTTAKILDNNVTTAKIADNNVTDAKIVGMASSKLTGALPAVDGSNLTGLVELLDEDNFASDSATKAPSQQSVKAYIGTTNYTKTEADSRFYNLGSVEEIQSGETWTAADDKVATTSAIDARIVDLVDDVGGFVPIANETSFPDANPDVNNGAGTLVSIKALASNLTSNGSGVATISNGNVSNNATVTINGLANSTTYAATIGMIVETTSTLHTYTFHRQTPDATSTTTVAGSISNVNTVASNISNVNTVASNNSNVTTVAGKATEIGRLGTTDAVADMALLGTTDCVADMAILGTSDVVADLNTLATADIVSDLDTVATNLTDVSNFADLYQIATSAPSNDGGGNALAAGDLWFDSSSNKVLKVYDGSAFAATSPSQSVLNDIANVSGQLTYKEDLGGIADALTTETGNNINTVATNINTINSFSDQYRVASSAPSSSLTEGDLWYDSTGNTLKYYNGSAWVVTAAAGLSEIVADTSPELGGNLDCNNKNLTEVGTVSGDNLQIDFGAIA